MCGEAAQFNVPLSESEMAVLSKGFTPAGTLLGQQEWKAERSRGDAEKCTENILDNPDPQNCWLSRFVVKIRKQDGQPYPPRTITKFWQVCKGYMLEKQPNATKFLDRTQTVFRELYGTCDSLYRGLHQQGFGTSYSSIYSRQRTGTMGKRCTRLH